MYSNRFECGQRRLSGDRRSRQWDDYDGSRENNNKYGADIHGRRSREYSDSPPRLYRKDSSNRRSPARRRMSSPASKTMWRRFAEDDGSDCRYRSDSREKTYRPPGDGFGHAHVNQDYEDAPPQHKDFKFTETQVQSHRYRQEDPRRDDVTYRRSYREREERERSWDCSQERSRDRSTASYGERRERPGSPPASTRQEDHHIDAARTARLSLNGSPKQIHGSSQSYQGEVTTQRGVVFPKQKRAEGFQRFLDVLNKGVNMDTLSKIVTQTSTHGGTTEGGFMHDSTTEGGFMHDSTTEGCFMHDSTTEGGFMHDSTTESGIMHSRTTEGGIMHGRTTEGGILHSRTMEGRTMEGSTMQGVTMQSGITQGGITQGGATQGSSHQVSSNPLVKATLTPEEEHKHRQMQDVLQAIGLDLGFEELGQMSHRIQQRLYGRKDGDVGCKGSHEGASRPARSPRCQSRSSSSSRSSFTPLHEKRRRRRDSNSAKRDSSAVRHCAEYQDADQCDSYFQQTTTASQLSPPSIMYAPSALPPTYVMPAYSPAHGSQLPYSSLLHQSVLHQSVPPSPMFPHAPPGLFLPHYPPPTMPFPQMPPQLAFPPSFSNPQLSSLNAPRVKAERRQRCLQVIETTPG